MLGLRGLGSLFHISKAQACKSNGRARAPLVAGKQPSLATRERCSV